MSKEKSRLRKQITEMKRQKKLEIKQAKLAHMGSKIDKVKKAPKVAKHFTASAYVGSKIITGFSGFLAAAAFYQYQVASDVHMAAILAGATIGASVIGAAPYARSVSRANVTLAKIDSGMSKVDSAVGDESNLVAQVVSAVERTLQQKGIASGEVQSLKAQVEQLRRDVMLSQAQPQAQAQVAQPKVNTPQKKNIVVD